MEGEKKKGNYQKAREFINEARLLSASDVDEVMHRRLCLNDLIIDRIDKMKILWENRRKIEVNN